MRPATLFHGFGVSYSITLQSSGCGRGIDCECRWTVEGLRFGRPFLAWENTVKKLLLGLLGLIVLIITVAVVGPFFIPVDVYKEQITVAARQATKRDLVIGGDVDLVIFPRLELQAEDVTFSNVAGGRAPQMVSLKELIVRLQLLPLLSGEVRVDSFVLVDPVIALEVDPDGNNNWTFASGTGEATTEPGSDPSGSTGLAEISLDDVRLENGKVSYRDARTAQAIELSAINVSVTLPSLSAPFEVGGSVNWNQKKVSFELAGENPRALMEGIQSAVRVALNIDMMSLDFDGTASVSEPLTVTGDVTLDVPSIRDLAAWTGNPIDAPGAGLGPLGISGSLAVKGSQVSFANAKIGLDGMSAEGSFLVETGGKLPYLKGWLNWDRLDLNLYMDQSGEVVEADTKANSSTVSGEWSDEKIDFSGLNAANVDFDLSVGEILLEQVKIGKSVVKVGLKDGRLTVNLTEMALYDGNGSANIVINGSAKVPLISKTFSVTGVKLEPLLTDATGFDKMSGTGNITFELNTYGRTERQLVAGSNGSGRIAVEDGAIRGANLGEMIRNSATAFLGKAEREEAKTEFAEMNGSFTVKSGVLSNQDLYMIGPYVKVTGAGNVDLNKRTLKYRMVPKAMASTGGADGAGVTVPVLVDGSWSDLRFRPDLGVLISKTIQSPKAVVEGAIETLKTIKKEGLRGLLEGLAPKAPPPPAGENSEIAPTPPNTNPKELLKGLFGG